MTEGTLYESCVHMWKHLCHLLLKFGQSCAENQINILRKVNVFRKLYRLWDSMEEYDTPGQATDNIT